MPEHHTPDVSPIAAHTKPPERRRNQALRELVDEMLASIRVAANRDLWTPQERQQYESELSHIMTRVRSEAIARQGLDGGMVSGEG
jgi:hypothetical protein